MLLSDNERCQSPPSSTMKCIVWNARGLGNRCAFWELQRLLTEQDPTLLFISEAKLSCNGCKHFSRPFGFVDVFAVNSIGRGMVICWADVCNVNILSYSSGHIDCNVLYVLWRFIGFYDNPNPSLCQHSWSMLRRLAHTYHNTDTPWLLGRDFDEICTQAKKRGGPPQSTSQVMSFTDVLHELHLVDLGANGPRFTGLNRRRGIELVRERLDRYVSKTIPIHNLLPTQPKIKY